MKKIYLLFISCISFCLSSLNAQVIFLEDFDQIPGPTGGGAGTYLFPSGWLLRNVDNLTPAAAVAYVNEAWERREDFSNNVNDSVAFSTSWYNPVGVSNDWMWTPLIGPLPANCVLFWNAITYDPSYPDGYEVRIMTAPSGPPTGGTGAIGNQITNSTTIFSIAAENTTWTSRQQSLNAYTGQSVYIGFRNISNNEFLLLIDDIRVEVQNNFDAQTTSASLLDSNYTIRPIDQAVPFNLAASITNAGISSLTNVQLTAEIYNGPFVVSTLTSSTIPSLAPAASNTFTIPGGYTPTSPGDYSVAFIATHTSGEEVPTNDTIWRYITISDSVIARDNGIITGALGIGAGNGGILGQNYTLVNPDTLSSITFYIDNPLGQMDGQPIYGVLYNHNGTIPTTIIDTTVTGIVNSADTVMTLSFDPPVALVPGTYFIGMVELDSTISLGTCSSLFRPNVTHVNWPTAPAAWNNNEDYGFNVVFMLRGNFGFSCEGYSAGISSSTNETCVNCNDGTATVVVTSGGTGSTTYSWSPAGGSSATASALAPGSYTVTVTDGLGCVATATTTIDSVNCSAFASSITASTDETCAGCNDGSATVTPTGGSGTYTYLWAPSGGTSSTASNLAPGVYTVTITDGVSGCGSTATVTINGFASIDDQIGLSLTQVYPNPSDGLINIAGNILFTGKLNIEVFTMKGEAIFNKPITIDHQINTTIQLNVAPGNYIIRLTAGNYSTSKEITIR